jgi:hypothetical protein
MPYLHRRSIGYVDLLLEKENWVEIVIKDSLHGNGGGDYLVTLNGLTFVAQDPDPNADSSPAIATILAGLIDDSSLDAEVSSSGDTVLVKPLQKGAVFSVKTWTTDIGGGMYHRITGPDEYILKTALNWDLEFLAVADMVASHGRSTTVKTKDIGEGNPYAFRNRIRYRFHPQDLGLVDDDVIFYKVTPSLRGVEGSDGPLHMILPPQQINENRPLLVLTGEAPIGDAQEFNLPLQASSFHVTNLDEASTVYLSFDDNPYQEIPIEAEASASNLKTGFSKLRIRTDALAGSPAEVSIHLTLISNQYK